MGGLCWLLAAQCLLAQCPDQNITLLTQSDVDAFVADWPDCAELEVDLTLGPQWNNNDDDIIIDISGLDGLQSINGILRIRYLMNEDDEPISLAGLQNLHTVKRLHIGLPVSFQMPVSSIPLGDLSPLSNIQGEMSELMVTHITNDTLQLFLNDVTKIGRLGFNMCPSLQRLPAFPSLEKVYMLQVGNTGIDSLFLPESITRIGHPDDEPETSYDWGFLAPVLEVFSNPQLKHFEHSGEMDYLPSLFAQYNALLESIAGFDEVTHMSGMMFIENNDNLAFFTGFANLDSISGTLNIDGVRPKLFDALPRLRFASDIVLRKTGPMDEGISEIAVTIGHLSDSLYQQAGPDHLFVLSMTSPDSFGVHFISPLTSTSNSLYISGNMMELQGFQHLRKVGHHLEISAAQTLNLPEFESLEHIGGWLALKVNNVDTIKGFNSLEYLFATLGIRNVASAGPNTMTKAIKGFEILETLGGINFFNLNNLQDFSELGPNLQTITGIGAVYGIRFQNLDSLGYFENALGALTSITGPILLNNTSLENNFFDFPAIEGASLRLSGNPNLTHTDFLQNISSLSGLEITNHPNLTSVTAHPDVNFSGPLVIEGNEALSNCANESLCHMIAQASSVGISGNGSNCNGAESILEACTQLGTDEGGPADIRIWNDGHGVLHLSAAHCYFEGAVHVLDLTGRTQRSTIAVKDSGVQVPVAGLASGVYVVHGQHCGSPFAQKVFIAR